MEKRDIKNFKGYQVDTFGNIYSPDGKMMKTQYSQGHPFMGMDNGTFRTKRRIAWIVAEAFIPNPNNYSYVGHLNDDVNDNRVENLVWSDVACDVQGSLPYRINEFIKANYKGITTYELAAKIKADMGYEISRIKVKNFLKNHRLSNGVDCTFRNERNRGHFP
jgi:elongation factor P hydroxylase